MLIFDGAAGEGRHKEPRGEVAVALELEEGLDGFVGHDYGCVGGFVVEEKAAQEDGCRKYAIADAGTNFFCHASLTA